MNVASVRVRLGSHVQQTISAVYQAQQFGWGEAASDQTTVMKRGMGLGEGKGEPKGFGDPFICPLAVPPQVEVNVK